MDLSIVIVNYNTGKFLRECLRSVGESDLARVDWEVVVVDNGSFDGSIGQAERWLAKRKSVGRRVKIINLKENRGFSAGNNVGMAVTKGEYVLFLNPDTVLPGESLRQGLAFIGAHGDVGAVAINMRLPDGRMDEAMHRGFPTPWNAFCFFSGLTGIFPHSRWFSGYTLGWKLGDRQPHEIDSGSGAFMLVRREVGEKVGWWDEDYFWNGDDLDFCFRIKEAGWKVMFLPQVKGIHFRGISSGVKGHSREMSGAVRATRLTAAGASTEAMEIFYKKHYADKYPKIITGVVMGGVKMVELVRRVRARWF